MKITNGAPTPANDGGKAQYGYNKATGEWERCRAKPGNEGRYGCPHSKHMDMNPKEADERNVMLTEARAKLGAIKAKPAKAANGGMSKTNPDEDMNPTAPETERITTLLTEKIPLKNDRKGKVPSIAHGDTPLKIQGKLGRYLANNFDGDKAQASINAIKACYPNADVIHYNEDEIRRHYADDDKIDADRLVRAIRNQKDYLIRKSDDPNPTVLFNKTNGHVVFVSDGKINKGTVMLNGRFNSGGVADEVNFGRLLGAHAVMSRMNIDGISDTTKTRVAENLLNNDEYTWWVDKSWNNPYSQLGSKVKNAIRRRHDDLGKKGVKVPVLPQSNADDDAWRHAAIKMDDPKADDNDSLKIREHVSAYDRSKYAIPQQYDRIVRNILDDETNGEMNYNYAKTTHKSYSAKIYELKKNRDPKHDEAAKRSSFADDFSRVEIDNSVDLSKLDKISDEWKEYRSALPPTIHKASFGLRKTGRHHATGVYTPAFRNIAVDPRYTPSTTHEYYHHWDFDSKANGSQQSMQEDFRPIVSAYRDGIDKRNLKGIDPDRYLAPTEVLARAGELYTHWKNPGHKSSFLKTDDDYENRFDFKPLLLMKREIIQFFDSHFNDAGEGSK